MTAGTGHDRPDHDLPSTRPDRVGRIRGALQQGLEPDRLHVADDSAAHAGHAGARAGGHFRVHVVAARFRGHSRVQRHRLVYQAVAGLMGSDIHALSIVAETPEESSS